MLLTVHAAMLSSQERWLHILNLGTDTSAPSSLWGGGRGNGRERGKGRGIERGRNTVMVLEHKHILFSEKAKSIGYIVYNPFLISREGKESLDLLS